MKELAFLAVLVGGVAFAAYRPGSPSEAIRRWNKALEPEPLSRVVVTTVPGRPDLVAAICDYQDEWWGFFGVYQRSWGFVRWQARLQFDIGEQSVHQVRALELPGFHGPIFEVFGMTHMGNGCLYLCELQGKDLVLLLQTKAVDSHGNFHVTQIQDGILIPEYRDVNGDGVADLILTGTIEEWDNEEDILLACSPCRQVFLWDGRRQKFVEDLTQRVAPDGYFR